MSAIPSTRGKPLIAADWRAVLRQAISRAPAQRGLLIGAILVLALFAFETFNFSTTQFALNDLLGDFTFAGIAWATILALAFCSIDFAGIARLLTPESGQKTSAEVWYLLVAWLLGATMNAMLTWWSVSLALIQHQGLGNEILGRTELLNSVPVFIAALVWLIRVLLIGSLTLTGERLFSLGQQALPAGPTRTRRPSMPAVAARPLGSTSANPVGAKPRPAPRREPSYAPDPVVARGQVRG
jgi:hypothetical protein